jgi:N-methylhydantoinase A
MLTAAPGLEFARSLPSPLPEVPWEEVRRAIDQMVREGVRHLRETGVGPADVRMSVAADVRHRGQGESVTVELGERLGRQPARQVEEAFHQAYVSLYGRRPPGVEAEVMTWRARTLGPDPRVDVEVRNSLRQDAGKGSRAVWFQETGVTWAEVFDRYRLGPGSTVAGPAIIEERESTVVIGPGGYGRVDGSGNLIVEAP